MFGLEHFSNCHGELTMIGSFLASLPFIGLWIRSKMKHKH